VSRKKSDICRAVGARVLIDDNPAYAVECATAGIHVLLFDWQDGYPWSKLKPGYVA
jgi:thiamine monophosphate synthase